MPDTEKVVPTLPKTPSRQGFRLRKFTSFQNISAIYVFIAIFIVFAIWVPDTFLVSSTWVSLLDSQAVTAVLAIGLVITMAAGAFDLAIGAELGFGSIMVAWLLVVHGIPLIPAIILALLAGGLVGLVSGMLIVYGHIDSFIATLGLSSVLLALTAWISHSQQILGIPSGLTTIGTTKIFGITLPVYIMLILAVLVWYLLERTPLGRRVYATGGNIEAARLAGVRVSAVLIGALVAGGAVAALAGILVSARLGTGDPTIGPAYLLPAFSAAFLGSTQFRGGRFNVWGTVVAVYVLATGVLGLQLAGAPVWIPDFFNGAALLIAVGMARSQGANGRFSAVRRLFRFKDNGPDEPGNHTPAPVTIPQEPRALSEAPKLTT
jgi:ribose transport system permease protein